MVGVGVASFEILGGNVLLCEFFSKYLWIAPVNLNHYFTSNYEHARKCVAAWAKQCTITFSLLSWLPHLSGPGVKPDP